MIDAIYSIVKENNVIGKGTFGKIYYNQKSFPNYVVKKMNKYNKIGNSFISNNIKELWWYYFVSNNNIFENIPNMISYHIDSEYIYLLLEHKGKSIYNKIKEINSIKDENEQKNKHIELLKIIPLIIYSCSKVLLYLNYASMRHGDITTSNILIKEDTYSDNKQIYITDWGSFVFNKTIISKNNQCAIDFASPELKFKYIYECCNNIIDKNISIKSDIFSLGIVILNIIDPSSNFIDNINNYIKNSEMNDYQYDFLENTLKSIKEQKDYISTFVDDHIFFLLTKMLDINIQSRIDIDSLYMSHLFTNFKKLENDKKKENEYLNFINIPFNKYNLRNNLKSKEEFRVDSFKNLLVDKTYYFLKKFKSKCFKPLLDTRIIIVPSLQLFYKYLNKIELNKFDNINNNINNNINTHINHYILSFLCCLKWIDIIINDDISVYCLYEYYIELYTLLKEHFNQSIMLELVNFLTMFDLTFYLIIDKVKGTIFTYPDLMDLNYKYIDHNSIKKLILASNIF